MEKINTDCKRRTWKILGLTFQVVQAAAPYVTMRSLAVIQLEVFCTVLALGLFNEDTERSDYRDFVESVYTFTAQVTFSSWAQVHSVGRWRSQILVSVKSWIAVTIVWTLLLKEPGPTGTSPPSALLWGRSRQKYHQRYWNASLEK